VFAVHHGDLVFPVGSEGDAGDPSPLDLLTQREREVLHRIASGDTNKEIAARFGISPRTVETHRESLMEKLGIHTVAGLTKLAMEEGLL
jgi:DNA-binding CsgD family transcriptional regulator